jgi:hypothetical protein
MRWLVRLRLRRSWLAYAGRLTRAESDMRVLFWLGWGLWPDPVYRDDGARR